MRLTILVRHASLSHRKRLSAGFSPRTRRKNKMASFNPHTQTGLDIATAKDFFLKNPNLITKTFSHLQAKNDKKNLQCLLNAALTCKNFLDVALDTLWEELYSMVPLLKLLPALRFENDAYVCANVHDVFFRDLILSLDP